MIFLIKLMVMIRSKVLIVVTILDIENTKVYVTE